LYSATLAGAIDLMGPRKKAAAALPSAELKIGFHLSSNMSAPNDCMIGHHEPVIGLPLTPRKT
jgi:hypothetical protein